MYCKGDYVWIDDKIVKLLNSFEDATEPTFLVYYYDRADQRISKIICTQHSTFKHASDEEVFLYKLSN